MTFLLWGFYAVLAVVWTVVGTYTAGYVYRHQVNKLAGNPVIQGMELANIHMIVLASFVFLPLALVWRMVYRPLTKVAIAGAHKADEHDEALLRPHDPMIQAAYQELAELPGAFIEPDYREESNRERWIRLQNRRA